MASAGDRRRSVGFVPGDPEAPVFVISVAAELAGVHPQTLRIYERKGLLQPARTAGNTRTQHYNDGREWKSLRLSKAARDSGQI